MPLRYAICLWRLASIFKQNNLKQKETLYLTGPTGNRWKNRNPKQYWEPNILISDSSSLEPFQYTILLTIETHGEGNGKPLQYSCLENPVDRGAWWAAVHRVAQSRIQLKWFNTHACIGGGNGNPLQYSCLENPRDQGAWCAVVCGVAQNGTGLKRLSSSSSSSIETQIQLSFFFVVFKKWLLNYTYLKCFSWDCTIRGKRKGERVAVKMGCKRFLQTLAEKSIFKMHITHTHTDIHLL